MLSDFLSFSIASMMRLQKNITCSSKVSIQARVEQPLRRPAIKQQQQQQPILKKHKKTKNMLLDIRKNTLLYIRKNMLDIRKIIRDNRMMLLYWNTRHQSQGISDSNHINFNTINSSGGFQTKKLEILVSFLLTHSGRHHTHTHTHPIAEQCIILSLYTNKIPFSLFFFCHNSENLFA